MTESSHVLLHNTVSFTDIVYSLTTHPFPKLFGPFLPKPLLANPQIPNFEHGTVFQLARSAIKKVSFLANTAYIYSEDVSVTPHYTVTGIPF